MQLIILAIIASFATADDELSELSQELLAEQLISLDENGVPTTTCLVSQKNGTSSVQLCTMTSGFGPRSVGCFSVWNAYGLMQQGCYSNQECQKRVCVADDAPATVFFCCCHGPGCNADYKIQ